ncbi:MAG: lipopolysaccharide biosynthesis protein [Gemmatimonadetes bacterium]|nr:lipopolysaccharide biosynthesis protein [Gemmatimonadota bacterium]
MSTAEGAASLRVYVAALRKHARLVVVLPIILGFAALGGSLLRSRMYVAKAAFLASEPQSLSGSLGALSSVASQLGIPALSAVASSSAGLSTQFYGDLLTSNELLHAVVLARYDASAEALNGGKPFAGRLVDYMHAGGKTATDSELDAMTRFSHNNLSVTVDRTTGIVRLQVKTTNRKLSALVTRKLLDLVNEFNLRRRQTQAGAEREFDARRARAALDSLHVAEGMLADFRATNIDFSRSPRLATRETELIRRVAFAQTIYTTVAQRYEMANIEAVRNTPVITVLDGPEGLVEAQPRHTALIATGAFLFGLVLACALALHVERLTALS